MKHSVDRMFVEFRYVFRSIAHRPGAPSATAIVSIIGIVLTTVIFAMADPFLSRPLPYEDPGRLAIVRFSPGQSAVVRPPRPSTLSQWRARRDLFEGVAAYGEMTTLYVSAKSERRALRVREVSPNFLILLAGASHAFPEPPVVGHVLAAPRGLLEEGILTADDGQTWHVSALYDRRFLFPHPRTAARPDALIPVRVEHVVAKDTTRRNFLTLIVRLKEGVGLEAVRDAMSPDAAAAGLQLSVEPMSRYMSQDVRPLARGALAAALMIVLVCVANVVNLVTTRAISRRGEFAIRDALGAGRYHMLRLIALEVTVGAAAAGLAGLALARVLLTILARAAPDRFVAIGEPAIGGREATFAAAVAASMAVACLIASWLGARGRRIAWTARAQDGASAHARHLRLGAVGAQVGFAALLIVAAAFLLRSYVNLWLQDTGLSADTRILQVRYPPTADPTLDVANTIDALRRVPGVMDAAGGLRVGALMDAYSAFGGSVVEAGERGVRIAPSHVTPSYFNIAGIRLLSGRLIGSNDSDRRSVVVNRAFAALAWPDRAAEDIAGLSIRIDGSPAHVAGVVENALDRSLDLAPVPRVYTALVPPVSGSGRVHYAVAAQSGTASHLLARAVTAVNSIAIIESNESVRNLLRDSVRDRTFATLVLALFGAAAVLVSATGVFGIVAFSVASRTREIAIRLALGAGRSHILRTVTRDAAAAGTAGALCGLLLGYFQTRVLQRFLFGVAPGDPATVGLAVVLLLVVAVAAALVPARFALCIEPAAALKSE